MKLCHRCYKSILDGRYCDEICKEMDNKKTTNSRISRILSRIDNRKAELIREAIDDQFVEVNGRVERVGEHVRRDFGLLSDMFVNDRLIGHYYTVLDEILKETQ